MSRESDRILYLSGREVEFALRQIDPVAAVREALVLQARGETVLPAESHLAWTGPLGEHARSLSMPAYLGNGAGVAGVKVISANPANVGRGLPRASGIALIFDPDSGRPLAIMDAARISSLRTAAASAIAADCLAVPGAERLAIIGAGELGRAHLDLLTERLPRLGEVRLCDLRVERAAALAREVAPILDRRRIELRLHRSAERAMAGAQIVVAVTTATRGYIRLGWLETGALLLNVSLDDPLPEVIRGADRLIVDDWELVRTDARRLLGRLYRHGRLVGPDESVQLSTAEGWPRRVDAELGQVLTATRPGRERDDELIVFNPFGLAIEDLCIAGRVLGRAREKQLGVRLER